MFLLVCMALTLSAARAAPGIFGELDLGDLHAAPLDAGHVFPAPVLAPAFLKTPVIAPVPAPIFKTLTPIVKHIAPATSYATVTQFHVTHPATVVKAVVAPPPILKTFAIPSPIALGHGDVYH